MGIITCIFAVIISTSSEIIIWRLSPESWSLLHSRCCTQTNDNSVGYSKTNLNVDFPIVFYAYAIYYIEYNFILLNILNAQLNINRFIVHILNINCRYVLNLFNALMVFSIYLYYFILDIQWYDLNNFNFFSSLGLWLINIILCTPFWVNFRIVLMSGRMISI